MGKKMGRPLKELDRTQFEKLCELQCTLAEMTCYFDVADTTLERWCKRTYGMTFAEVFKIKRMAGLISLRRKQFRLAEKSAAMAIFLGKNYLGQTDKDDWQRQQEEKQLELRERVVEEKEW